MKSRLIGVACLAAFALSGCALTTDHITLEYRKQPGAVELAAARGVKVSVEVSDLRQDKSKVSSKKNGYGMEMAPILATEDVAVTVRKAIETELSARGFQLDPNALVKISGDLVRFYNDHKVGFFAGDAIAEFNMTVTVKDAGGKLLYSRQVMTQGMEKNTQLATGDNAKLALDRALDEGMKTLFEDQAFLTALTASSTRLTAR